MKHILAFVLLVFITNGWSQIEPVCPENGGAEFNNFTNWTTYTSTAQNPQQLNAFVQNFDTLRTQTHDNGTFYSPNLSAPMLVNGVDQYGLFSVPSEGNYCFSIGNNKNASQADMMKYTFTVNSHNKKFKIRYAVVLEDGGHGAGENPAAWFYMVKGNNHFPQAGGYPLFTSTFHQIIADTEDPFFKRSPINNDVVYKDWECIEFDLSAYVGEEVSFVAVSRDCTNGAHFGYMYLDGVCSEWPAVAHGTLNGTTFCREQTIVLDGAASEGEESYYLEVAEVDQNGNYYPDGNQALFVSEWFVAQQVPNNININAFLDSKNVELECGRKYKVKLAVLNHCSPWDEQNFIFDIVCPQVNAGQDLAQCCQGEGIQTDGVLIGTPTIAGNVYSWYSVPSGLNSNSSLIMVNPTSNTAYILNMTTPDGCIGSDTVIFSFLPSEYTLNITTDYVLCDNAPYATAHLMYQGCETVNQEFLDAFGYPDAEYVNWFFQPVGGTFQFIGTGGTIQVPNEDGLLKATISNGCSSIESVATKVIPYRPGGSGLISPNTFTPDGDGVNDVFRILEYGDFAPENIGDGPAYGIEDFKLRIWNRWGTNFKTVTKADAGRAPEDYVRQGDIFWDGTDNNGVVQDGVYNYTLEVKYCGHSHYERVCMDGMETDPCIQEVWIFCTMHLDGCCGMVTVVR